jgi:3'(2'), 5'-bisphosphate nucleotidase
LTNLIDIAIKAALDAGSTILQVYDTDFDVDYKTDDSPLTIADQKANAVIESYLKTTHLPIISEETKTLSYSERQHWTRCWIVDPLDGTKEFIKRNGEFTVNIALVENGQPIMGVIYAPVLGDLYYTENNAAYKISIDSGSEQEAMQIIDSLKSKATKLQPAPWQDPIKVVGSRSHMNEATQEFVTQLQSNHQTEMVSKGSSLKFCLVAEGSAHVYPRFAPTMEWDTAAGQAICHAAGLKVIRQDTGAPLTYNRENLLNPYFLIQSHDR